MAADVWLIGQDFTDTFIRVATMETVLPGRELIRWQLIWGEAGTRGALRGQDFGEVIILLKLIILRLLRLPRRKMVLSIN